MKRANKLFTHLGFALLMGSLLVACGKENKSGQGNLSQYGINALGVPGQFGQIDISQVSHPIVLAAIQQNTCLSGQNSIMNQQMLNQYQMTATSRYGVQFPLTGQTGMVAGDYYLGVTSYGDVAVVVGQGISAPPVFVAYICPRGGLGGQGQLAAAPQTLSTGPYCGAAIKPMNATLFLPGVTGTDRANFRWADGGTSMGVKFSFCTGMIR